MAYDLFIAHAGADAAVADELYAKLTELGMICFLDTRCLRLGDDWDLMLPQAQLQSAATVVLVSDKCDRAFYQREEIAAAIEMSRANPNRHRVIPFYITEPTSSQTPYGLRTKHGLYLTREITLAEAAAKLAQAVSSTRPLALTPARTLSYDVDICMCIDVSNSLIWLVNLMKRQLLTLGYDIVGKMSESGKSIGRIRVSVITFGPEDFPIERTPMIELPSGAAVLYERVLRLQLVGGGPPVSQAIEAIDTAIDSDWSGGAGRRRHIIAIWTDRAAAPSSKLKAVSERWQEMNRNAKRHVMFAPDEPTWRAVGSDWENVIWFPVSAGEGLTGVVQDEILTALVGSV